MATMDQLPPEQLAILAQEDYGPLSRNIVYAFTAIAFVSVSLRLYTRLRYLAVGWEDYIIVVSMFFSLATGVCQVLQTNAGNGKHAIFVPFPEGVERVLKYLFWSIITYNTGLMFTKISIILQYQRIFTLREMRLPLDIAMGICVALGIATFFTSVFTCVPATAYYRILERSTAKCLTDENLWFTNAAMNVFTDLMIALLPVNLIWSLQIPKKQKVALIGILSIGWFVCVVSILRLKTLVVLSKHPDDRTFYSAATVYWSSIEINLGILCASLPALKPLITNIIPSFSLRHDSRGYGTVVFSSQEERHYEPGGRALYGTNEEDIELATKSTNDTIAYNSRANQGAFDKNIYVTQHVEQHFERIGHISDSESIRDLIQNTTP